MASSLRHGVLLKRAVPDDQFTIRLRNPPAQISSRLITRSFAAGHMMRTLTITVTE